MRTGEPALEGLLDLAVSIAVEAGRVLSERFSAAGPTQAVTDSVRSKSSRTDLVTEADQASERLIVSRLAAARPGDAILAEEGGSSEGTSGLTWIVDPLDGTINFVYGLPVFGISIACSSDSTTLLGVVHDPIRAETFIAVSGGGAFRDGIRLRLSAGPPLSEALVGTGFSYESERRRAQGRLVAHVLPEVRDVRRAGAAAIDLCWVASGRLDGFWPRCAVDGVARGWQWSHKRTSWCPGHNPPERCGPRRLLVLPWAVHTARLAARAGAGKMPVLGP